MEEACELGVCEEDLGGGWWSPARREIWDLMARTSLIFRSSVESCKAPLEFPYVFGPLFISTIQRHRFTSLRSCCTSSSLRRLLSLHHTSIIINLSQATYPAIEPAPAECSLPDYRVTLKRSTFYVRPREYIDTDYFFAKESMTVLSCQEAWALYLPQINSKRGSRLQVQATTISVPHSLQCSLPCSLMHLSH